MSPRYIPAAERERSAEADAIEQHVNAEAREAAKRCTASNPYTPLCGHSWFKDKLLVAEEDKRAERAIQNPILRGRPDPAQDASDHDLGEAKQRLRTVHFYPGEKRDLSQSSIAEGVKASMPGYLATIWGQASRSVGTLAAVFEMHELVAGMVDTSSGVPVVSIPRLSGGASTAVQASQNAAVSETDPTSTSMSSAGLHCGGPGGYVAAAVRVHKPGLDAVIADDLSRSLAANTDIEIVSGTASAGRTRGLLNWSGILSVTGTVTNAQTFLNSVWQAYSALAGASAFGASNSDGYVTILHPRRAAWLAAGVSGVLPPGQQLLPGQLVVSAGIPSNLGAGTNEDVALVVERSQVLLLAQEPTIQVFPEVGSTTLTVRVQGRRAFAVLVKNANAIAKVTGLTPPSGSNRAERRFDCRARTRNTRPTHAGPFLGDAGRLDA